MTPNCLRRMLEPYAARLTGSQGYHKFPHSVMGARRQGPRPGRLRPPGRSAGRGLSAAGSAQAEAGLPLTREGPPGLRPGLPLARASGYQACGLLPGRLHPRRRPRRRRSVAQRGLIVRPISDSLALARMPDADQRTDRLLILGLDGATWTVLDPMRARGLMPNLDALLARSATARCGRSSRRSPRPPGRP